MSEAAILKDIGGSRRLENTATRIRPQPVLPTRVFLGSCGPLALLEASPEF